MPISSAFSIIDTQPAHVEEAPVGIARHRARALARAGRGPAVARSTLTPIALSNAVALVVDGVGRVLRPLERARWPARCARRRGGRSPRTTPATCPLGGTARRSPARRAERDRPRAATGSRAPRTWCRSAIATPGSGGCAERGRRRRRTVRRAARSGRRDARSASTRLGLHPENLRRAEHRRLLAWRRGAAALPCGATGAAARVADARRGRHHRGGSTGRICDVRDRDQRRPRRARSRAPDPAPLARRRRLGPSSGADRLRP